MFYIVIVVSVYVCIVIMVSEHFLYCNSGWCTYFVLQYWYVYMLCTAKLVRVHVFVL